MGKEEEVKNNLVRIGNLKLPKINPIKGAINSYFYRNKMEYSFSDSRWLSLEEIKSKKIIKQKNALGFHIPGMWNKVLTAAPGVLSSGLTPGSNSSTATSSNGSA